MWQFTFEKQLFNKNSLHRQLLSYLLLYLSPSWWILLPNSLHFVKCSWFDKMLGQTEFFSKGSENFSTLVFSVEIHKKTIRRNLFFFRKNSVRLHRSDRHKHPLGLIRQYASRLSTPGGIHRKARRSPGFSTFWSPCVTRRVQ